MTYTNCRLCGLYLADHQTSVDMDFEFCSPCATKLLKRYEETRRLDI